MKCWECRKKVSSAFRVRYSVYNEEVGYKGKFRYVCEECYPKLKRNSCHFVEVNEITQRSLYK